MKVYDLCCPFHDYELKQIGLETYEWLVHWYDGGCYEGSGEAVGYKDGNLYIYNLSHCSCYGPLEGSPTIVSVEKYKAELDDVLGACQFRKEVAEKIQELLP